jgi:pyruvate,water dikinase
VIQAGVPRFAPPAGAVVLRGHGTGGRARGRARVVAGLAGLAGIDPSGCVLVVPALLPAMTFALARAAAVVADHGGVLDHGAYHAREYGVPAVLATSFGTSMIADGRYVTVDADAGRVYVE